MSDTAIPDSVMQKAREVAAAWRMNEFTAWELIEESIALAILAAQQEEREACAKIAEEIAATDADDYFIDACAQVATAIRAKGQ